MIKASTQLRCKKLYVITLDYEKEEKLGKYKIVFKPLWKWLMDI